MHTTDEAEERLRLASLSPRNLRAESNIAMRWHETAGVIGLLLIATENDDHQVDPETMRTSLLAIQTLHELSKAAMQEAHIL